MAEGRKNSLNGLVVHPLRVKFSCSFQPFQWRGLLGQLWKRRASRDNLDEMFENEEILEREGGVRRERRRSRRDGRKQTHSHRLSVDPFVPNPDMIPSTSNGDVKLLELLTDGT